MAFDTPNTTIQVSWGVPNVSKFCNMLQYYNNFGTIQNNIAYVFIIFLFNFFSLFSHIQLVFSFLLLQIRFPHPHRSLTNQATAIASSLKTPSPPLIYSSPIWSCVVLHNSHYRWLVEFGHWLIYWVGVLLKILSFFFFFLFCWGFWIWNFIGHKLNNPLW